MIYGLYLSGQGAEAQSQRHEVNANNLANAGTTAFKRDLALFQSHPPFDLEHGQDSDVPGNANAQTGGLSVAGIVTDFSNGSLTPTGGELDLGLVGPGFLRVTDGETEFLTRNGRLSIDPEGRLAMFDTGHAVLDQNGLPIFVPPDTTKLQFTAEGTVVGIGPDNVRAPLAQLALAEPQFYHELVKEGDSLYRPLGGLVPAGPGLTLKQGFLEESGTRPVTALMEMIDTSRAFETNMNMIHLQDEMLSKLMQSVTRR